MIKRRIFLLVLILSLGLSTMSGTVRQVPDDGEIIPVKFKPKRTIDDNTGHPFPHSIVKCPSVGVCGRTLYLYDVQTRHSFLLTRRETRFMCVQSQMGQRP